MVKKVSIVPRKGAVELKQNSKRICEIPYFYTIDGKVSGCEKTKIEKKSVFAPIKDSTISDEFDIQEGFVRVRRKLDVKEKGKLKLHFSVDSHIVPKHWVVPAVMYDGNERGSGSFPKSGTSMGWSFREDRCAIPSCSIISRDREFVSVFARPAREESEISSILTRSDGKKTRLEISVPFSELPRRHTRKFYFRGLSKPKVKHFSVDGEFVYERDFYVIFGGGKSPNSRVYEVAFEELGQDRGHEDWDAHVEKKLKLLMNVFYIERGNVRGFLLSLGKTMFPLGNTLSGGFCGKNLEIALALYRAYLDNEMSCLRKAAISTANFFLRSRLANGLFLADYSLAKHRWYGHHLGWKRLVSTRMLGEMACNYLRLYQLVGKHEEANEEWHRMVERMCDFMVDHQPEDGNFGKWWSLDGRLLDASGTNGAYIIWPMLKFYELTKESRYLKSAKLAGDYHIRNCTSQQDYFGDALDSNCPDKEGGEVVLRSLLYLYSITGERKYLQNAILAGEYASTWMYTYNVPFAQTTPLGKRNFRTRGGTAVSVAHNHLDPYGAAIALDYLGLWKYTKQEKWKVYAIAALDFIHQMAADAHDRLGYPAFFGGYQPEQYGQTEWDYTSNTIWMERILQVLRSMGSCAHLGALFDIREEFPEVVNFKVRPFDLYESKWYALARAWRGFGTYINFVA